MRPNYQMALVKKKPCSLPQGQNAKQRQTVVSAGNLLRSVYFIIQLVVGQADIYLNDSHDGKSEKIPSGINMQYTCNVNRGHGPKSESILPALKSLLLLMYIMNTLVTC